jgi:predicted ATPase
MRKAMALIDKDLATSTNDWRRGSMHVLTGAPGTGKTALLRRLGDDVVTVDEPAREILAEQRAIGISETEPAHFVALLLERSIEKHRSHLGDTLTVFDRGLPDCVAYAKVSEVDASDSRAAALRYRHAGPVLILPPWEEIYTTDDERTMGFDLVVPFHEHLVEAYESAGYELVEVPKDTVEARVAFGRSVIEDTG